MQPSQYRNDIQGLRALAIMMVFIFHLDNQLLPGGYIGVDIFFVISGYIVTSSIKNHLDNRTFSFFQFYCNRIKRIIPAYFTCIILVCLSAIFIYTYTDFNVTIIASFKYAMFFYSNKLFSTLNSYFGAGLSENPYLHTWSLAIEMQYYCILPILYWIIRNRSLLWMLLVLSCTLYACYLIYYIEWQDMAYFSFLCRIPEFTLGVLIANNEQIFSKISYKVCNVLSILGFITLFICASLYNESTYFPGWIYIIPCISTCLLIAFPKSIINEILCNKIFITIGAWSYSIYLFHYPIMAFIRYYNGTSYFTILESISIIILTLVISYLSYAFIEKPIKKFTNRNIIIFWGVLSIISFILIRYSNTFSSYKKLPSQYIEPIYGLASHNKKYVEKIGDTTKKSSILFTGNSHALMLKPFLNEVGIRYNKSFETITCDSYPPLYGVDLHENKFEALYKISVEQRELFYTALLDKKILIMVLDNYYDNSSIYNAIATLAIKEPKLNIILLRSFPKLESMNIILKNKGYLKNMPALEQITMNENNAILNKIYKQLNNIYIYDVSKSQIFNDAPFYRDTLIYYNSSHINHHGSLQLAEDIGSDFNTFIDSILNR